MTGDLQVWPRLDVAIEAAASLEDLDDLRLQVIESMDLDLYAAFGRRWRALSPADPWEVRR